MKINKELLIKILIVILGFTSLILFYTSKITYYPKFTLKSYSIQLWISLIIWIVFIVITSIYTYKTSQSVKNKNSRLKYLIRNIVLLLSITVLLIYKIGINTLNVYMIANKTFDYIIYLLLGIILIFYGIANYMIDAKNYKKTIKKNKDNI